MIQYCTAGNYAVSGTTGTGIDGYILNVHISGSRPIQYVVDHMRFNNGEEADAYCLEHGYIQEYRGKI